MSILNIAKYFLFKILKILINMPLKKTDEPKNQHVFLQEKEGFIAQARDIGDGTLTIGFGITSAAYRVITATTLTIHTRISKVEAVELMNTFIQTFIRPELEVIIKTQPLNSNQEEALISLLFNIGTTAWKKSKARVALLEKNIPLFLIEAFDPVKGFLTKNKKFLKGLQNRRQDEKELFLQKVE